MLVRIFKKHSQLCLTALYPGPQIAWRTVFLIEYAGPILIHPLFYHFAPVLYPAILSVMPFVPAPPTPYPAMSQVQTLAYVLNLLHFAKREFETLFIHRFSHGTMPLLNLYKNSSHYWLLNGLLVALQVYGPWNARGGWTDKVEGSVGLVWAPVAVWAVM